MRPAAKHHALYAPSNLNQLFICYFFMRAERNDKKAVASTCEHQSPPLDIQQGEDARRRPSARRLFPGALFTARLPSVQKASTGIT
jgi:hypothetical protein